MPTGGDAHLDLQKMVLFANSIDGLKINFGYTIVDQLFFCAHKTAFALPFSCLIMELCKWDNVPLLKGVDNEVQAIHR